MLSRVEETWDELGFRLRAIGTIVFVRTDPLPDRTEGGIIVPQDQADVYGSRLGSKVHLTGTVLSACRTKAVGSKKDNTRPSDLKPGDKILFTRFEFAWLYKMQDGTRVGYIREPLIHAEVDPSVASTAMGARLRTG